MAHRQRRAVAGLVRDLKAMKGKMDLGAKISIPGVGGVVLRRDTAQHVAEEYLDKLLRGDGVQNTPEGRRSQKATVQLLENWLAEHGAPRKESVILEDL